MGETRTPTPVDVKLSLGLAGLSVQANTRLAVVLQRFADELAKEAVRIEEGERADGLAAEITATNIDDAYKALRRPRKEAPKPPPRTKTTKAVMVAQAVSGVVAGAMLTLLHSEWQVAVCTAVSVLFCVATLWLIFGDHG